MNKPLEFTFYLKSMNIGSMVLKAPGQYYKIDELIAIVPLVAEVAQFIRSVGAGASPHSLFTLIDVSSRKFDLALSFSRIVHMDMQLKTADGGKALVFVWEGRFGDFRDGFKYFNK